MILLDTHVLVWWRWNPEKLSKSGSAAIRMARGADGVAVSAYTLWELAWLFRTGRLRAPGTLQSSVERVVESVSVLPLTPGIAAIAAQFGDAYPADPGDRLIGATAVFHEARLITADEWVRDAGLVATIW